MKKMKTKKSSESRLSLENSDSLKNFIENQFQCSICKDIFVSPTIINCGHTFCDKCTVRTVNDFLGGRYPFWQIQGLPSGFDLMYLALADRNVQVKFGLKVVLEF